MKLICPRRDWLMPLSSSRTSFIPAPLRKRRNHAPPCNSRQRSRPCSRPGICTAPFRGIHAWRQTRAPADASANRGNLPCARRGAVCRRCFFAPSGRISDRGQRRGVDPGPRRHWPLEQHSLIVPSDRIWPAVAAHRAGNFSRRGAFRFRRIVSGAFAQSAGGSIRARRFQRRGPRRNIGARMAAACRMGNAGTGVPRRARHHRGGLFSRTPQRAARQHHAPSRGNHHRVVSLRHHHVLDDHGQRARSSRHGLLADGRPGDAARDQPRIPFRDSFARDWRDLHHVVGFEFDFDGRAGGASPGRERSAREARRLCERVAVDGPGRFRQRRNRLRRPADSSRDAHAFRFRLSRADPCISHRRRNRRGARGHTGAHDRRAHGASRRRNDGSHRRSRLYLFVTAEIRVSTPSKSTPDAGRDMAAGWMQNPVRLLVEQASYAYSASDREAPDFTLGPVTFSARQREIVGILGPNASGKSTLLRLLSGEIKGLSGRVELDGTPPGQLPLRERAQRIALVHQESTLLFPLRVWEYVLQGRYPHGRRLRFESPADCLLAENALAQVGAKALLDRRMNQLSGGEGQRVILARALAQQPLLLLLDEPTRSLDIGGKVELMRRLRRLAEENRYTVVVVTHELNLAAEFFDSIVLLQHGKCLASGKPADVYRRELLEQAFETTLDVETNASGRPRVTLRGGADAQATEENPDAPKESGSQ